ncbi:MAG: sulfatase-like hydrolase/transferase [Myxococcota bacterium]
MQSPPRDEPGASGGWRHDLVAGALSFGAVGVLDGALTFVRLDGGRSEALPALPLAVFLWVLVGAVAGLGRWAVWRLLAGRGGRDRVHARLRGALRRVVSERGTPPDRRRLARLVGVLAGLGVLAGASFVLLHHLITHRHGAALISLAFLAGQAVLVLGSAAAGLVVQRAVRALLDRLPEGRFRVLSLPGVVGVLLVLLLLGAGAAMVVFRDVAEATDAVSLVVLPALALLSLPLWDRPARRLAFRGAGAVVPAVALLVVGLSGQSSAARRALVGDGYTSKYVFSTAQALSDWDGDGAPFFPSMEDCAPFDPDRHPFATEIAGNGVDENCDGSDDVLAVDHDRRRLAPEHRQGPKPDLVLVTIDSLRPDHLGFGGYDRDTSPNLDAFADRSTLFTQAFSQDSGTGPSLWSLMAGKTPFQTRIDDTGRFPPNFLDSEVLLAEQLREAGYHTEALLCGAVFGTKHWNIRRGFDRYHEICGGRKSMQAEVVTKRARTRLRALRDGGEPFFLWVHYYDPHQPYHDHPDQDLGERPVDHYDEEIRYTDEHVGRFLDAATETRERPVYVALTADHGENFGEHGRAPHARTLYYEVTHVPLIMFGSDRPPRRVEEPVALNDIHPTFLDLADLSLEHTTMASQAPVLFGEEPDPDRLVFQENSFSRPKRHVKGVVGLGHHMIMDLTTGTTELYDLESDRAETRDLYGRGTDVEQRLEQALRAFIPTTEVPDRLAK